jgi:porin
MPLFGWSGGTLNATFQSQAGPDGSMLIGDLQVFSNIDADGRNQVSELWYEHVWEDTPWRVRLGKVDANTQFAFVENGLEFLQSSMGFSPTIFVMPTYPDPAFSANVFYEPDEGFFTGVGIYDGSLAQGIPTGSRGPGQLFRRSDVFVIGKVGWRWNAGVTLEDDSASLPGRFAAGAWFHNGQFDRFDGASQSGTEGIYLLIDQTVYRESDDPEDGQGLGVFAQYGYADPDVSPFEHHVGAGLTWTGALPGRDEDALGLGLSWAGLS